MIKPSDKAEPTEVRPHCRLSIIFASHAPVAVIFRRGPTEWCQAIRWNTLRDEFEPGQWLHGKVYPERCALSPHGELMVYFAYKSGGVNEAGGYRREFTAVSRPPYFTALALWPWIGTWGGGGHFKDDESLVLGAREVPAPHPDHKPRRLKVVPVNGPLAYGGHQPATMVQPAGQGDAPIVGEDQQGRQILIEGGALYERLASGEQRLLRDFNDDVPTPVACPPKYQRWP